MEVRLKKECHLSINVPRDCRHNSSYVEECEKVGKCHTPLTIDAKYFVRLFFNWF